MGDAFVPRWKTTQLWIALSERSGEPAERLTQAVADVLPDTETILDRGDSAPGTFTLHDSEHSRRVAQRIAKIAGSELLSKLEPYELGLLLLASYLHDIGMTPEVSRLDAILAFLLSGNSDELSEEEADSVQEWLDDNQQGIAPPLSDGDPSLATLRKARFLTAQYVRYRHNDWSEEWMRENLADLDRRTYVGCLSDLILLCKSHHYGLEHLRDHAFDPRFVGSPASVLHLRFDACLLRVADVLDFDPERAPKILYDHRDVDETSAVFWQKDHELSFVQDGGRISIHARPTNALIHHAIERTIEDVDRELQLSRRLAEETQFHRMNGRVEDLPHHWPLDAHVQSNVTPRNDEYVYIDGTFRPDQERILELLGGVALYGSPLVAIREALQNAFDAVREQIAYRRLAHGDPASDLTRAQIAATHSVDLIIERVNDGVRIRCTDTGVGMSRETITSRFLIGGSTASHETRALERSCEVKGFSVGRTAQFGIGVLSYFLLADKLRLNSRRSIDAGDRDGTGWSFVTHGLTDFGELRKNPECAQGTTVEFYIREDAMQAGADRFASDLRDYVERVVRRAPCRFSLTGPDFELQPFTSDPGWPDRHEETVNQILSSMSVDRLPGTSNPELLSKQRRTELDQRRRGWQKIKEKAERALEMLVVEGDLPEALGSCRISFGFFVTDGAVLLPFVDLSKDSNGDYVVTPIQDSHAIELGERSRFSWNGMNIAIEAPPDRRYAVPDVEMPGMVVEVDWTSDAAGELAVNRESVTLSHQALDALYDLREEVKAVRSELLEKEVDSPFALINCLLSAEGIVPTGNALWLEAGDDSSKARLVPLQLPVIDRTDGNRFRELSWRGERVSAAPALSLGEVSIGEDDWSWHGANFDPTFVGATNAGGIIQPVPVWTVVQKSPADSLPLIQSEFSPEWLDLASVECASGDADDSMTVWNRHHPVIRLADLESWEWVAETLGDLHDPLSHREDLAARAPRMAAWMLRCLKFHEEDLWLGLVDRAPDFLSQAWELIPGLSERKAIYRWDRQFGDSDLQVVSPSSWESFEGSEAQDEFEAAFGTPGEDWVI